MGMRLVHVPPLSLSALLIRLASKRNYFISTLLKYVNDVPTSKIKFNCHINDRIISVTIINFI